MICARRVGFVYGFDNLQTENIRLIGSSLINDVVGYFIRNEKMIASFYSKIKMQ